MYANRYAQVIETFSQLEEGVPDCIWIDTRWPWASCTSEVTLQAVSFRHLTYTGICEMRVCSKAAVMGVTTEGPIVEITQR